MNRCVAVSFTNDAFLVLQPLLVSLSSNIDFCHISVELRVYSTRFPSSPLFLRWKVLVFAVLVATLIGLLEMCSHIGICFFVCLLTKLILLTGSYVRSLLLCVPSVFDILDIDFSCLLKVGKTSFFIACILCNVRLIYFLYWPRVAKRCHYLKLPFYLYYVNKFPK